MPMLINANKGLQAKIKGEDVIESSEYGAIVDPTQTALIHDREMNLKRAKKAKQKEAKQLQAAMEQSKKMEAEPQQSNETFANANELSKALAVDELENKMNCDDTDEMKKAMAMSMDASDEQNVDENDNTSNDDKKQ